MVISWLEDQGQQAGHFYGTGLASAAVCVSHVEEWHLHSKMNSNSKYKIAAFYLNLLKCFYFAQHLTIEIKNKEMFSKPYTAQQRYNLNSVKVNLFKLNCNHRKIDVVG